MVVEVALSSFVSDVISNKLLGLLGWSRAGWCQYVGRVSRGMRSPSGVKNHSLKLVLHRPTTLSRTVSVPLGIGKGSS